MIIFALLALALTAAAAGSSARCILRRKNIPAESAKEVAVVLSGALFLVYFFAALLAYFLAAPQAAESFRQLLAQPVNTAPAPPESSISASPQPAEMPPGKISAEQDRTERLLLLAETAELLHRETDARYQLFGQEHAYIVAEGISGIDDRYIPPRPEQLAPAADTAVPQQSISVRELVSSSDDLASMLQPQTVAAPAQPALPPPAAAPAQVTQPPPVVESPPFAPPQPVPPQIFSPPESLVAQQIAPTAPVSSTPPAPQVLPAGGGIDQQIRTQEQGVQPKPTVPQQVACEEIRRSMDSTDLGVLRYAVTKPAGVVTPWKGPTGSYAVTAGAGAQGGCRDYALQAELRGRILRCQFSCARTTTGSPVQASRPARPQRSDKEVIREAMNSSDQEAFLQALKYYGPFSWRSSSGIFYTVSPVRLGNPCREYEVQANIHGRIFRYLESNCE
ncbi:MAG: hypothetical protein ACTFAL_13310 [Candidatus Electronema sp. V4]|uniref:hypothetical protein n=1 Tax=Candidatus Electronema sp. V4 TaxID=3454756 RepID=UPI0040557871